MIRRVRFVVAVVVLTGISGACATTIVDTSASTSTTGAPTTVATTVPVGDTSTLLTALHAGVRELSEIVVETGGDRAFEQLERIEALWERVRPAIATDHPRLVGDFDRMMALCRLAVERRRPADADKAYAFMTPLIEAVSSGT